MSRLRHLVRLREAEITPMQLTAPRTRKLLLWLSLGAFLVMGTAAFLALPDGTSVRWLPVVLLAVTIPLTTLSNAAEYAIIARVSGHAPSMASAIRITVMASAANLLPLPGALAIRTQALREEGIAYGRALSASGAAGAVWMGVTLLATGSLSLAKGSGLWPAMLFGFGLLAFAAAGIIIIRSTTRAMRHLGVLFVVEAVGVGVLAMRMAFAFGALGTDLSALQSVALTLPVVFSALIGIFPGGLGLREALAGLVGIYVALPLSTSVAATAIDRICAQVVLALIASFVLVRDRGSKAGGMQRERLGDGER